MANIKSGLGLTDTTYRSFYTAVEKEVIAKGWTGRSFRSISDKELAQKEMAQLVVANRSNIDRFPETMEHMRTSEGQNSFGCLVYKIRSNYWRRSRKQRSRIAEACSDGDDVHTASTASEGNSPTHLQDISSAATPAPQDRVGDLRHIAVWVLEGEGAMKAACRLGDLEDKAGVVADHELLSIDDLDFERFCSIMADDHGFERGRDVHCGAREAERVHPPDHDLSYLHNLNLLLC